MASRAGARIVNADTSNSTHHARCAGAEGFLISEAVGVKADSAQPGWPGFHGGLLAAVERPCAPRLVARAIHHQMEVHGYSYVLLDIASPQPRGHPRRSHIYANACRPG